MTANDYMFDAKEYRLVILFVDSTGETFTAGKNVVCMNRNELEEVLLEMLQRGAIVTSKDTTFAVPPHQISLIMVEND